MLQAKQKNSTKIRNMYSNKIENIFYDKCIYYIT